MKGWNPFGKVDMEVGSFLKSSPFNKEYRWGENDRPDSSKENKKEQNK